MVNGGNPPISHRRGAPVIVLERMTWACGATGSARHWQCRGQGFESPQVHQFNQGGTAEKPFVPDHGDERFLIYLCRKERIAIERQVQCA